MKHTNMFQGLFVTELPLGTQQKKPRTLRRSKASGFRCEPALWISNTTGRRKMSFKATDFYVAD